MFLGGFVYVDLTPNVLLISIVHEYISVLYSAMDHTDGAKEMGNVG